MVNLGEVNLVLILGVSVQLVETRQIEHAKQPQLDFLVVDQLFEELNEVFFDVLKVFPFVEPVCYYSDIFCYSLCYFLCRM